MLPSVESLNKHELTIRHSADGFSYVFTDSDKKIILFDNDKHTFVPAALYLENKKEKYLDFLGLTKEKDVICTDYISNADAYNIYQISEQDFQTLNDSTEKTEYYHVSSVLVSDLIKLNQERTDDPRIYLNIKNMGFEMIVLKGCKLLFNNNFRFKTKEDFLYFLLFSIEQLHLDAGSVPVYFLGMIEEKSKLVELTARYVRDIRFMSKDFNFLYKSKTCE